MKQAFLMTTCALAAFLSISGLARAQSVTLDKIEVAGKRESRVSKGATNLQLELKDTPQSISTIDKDDLRSFGITGSLDALRYGTGVNVEQYETNRSEINARGFQVMLTQVDGLGMSNDWGSVVGQQDAYLFERIELIRGANGLLTGLGNSSGTINYVRKRPTNKDGGELVLSGGSYNFRRAALDYNQVLGADRSWAGRLVVVQEDKDSYLRALRDKRSTVYGVVDGQIGDHGVLTFGFGFADTKQRSPMWGSMTLARSDGTQAEFDRSASPAQDWTMWDTRSYNAFIEYTHAISNNWEGKLTYNHRHGSEAAKLFYAYSLTGVLNPDNTGLIGWPYRSESKSTSKIFDANLAGHFSAFGRRHEATVGLSFTALDAKTEEYGITSEPGPAAPAFPYPGNFYPEPSWGAKTTGADGEQKLARFYAATRLALADRLKAILGVNAVSLKRNGTSIYGGGVSLDNEKTEKASPYVGVTYDVTPSALVYTSYSDIFQVQDQRLKSGGFVAPMKGVNGEVGIKAEWLDRKLLGTFAVFQARQNGIAVEAGFDPVAQRSWYEPKDVKSRGLEAELTGQISKDTRLTAGYTHLKLSGSTGGDTSEWIPRNTVNFRVETRLAALPALRVGVATRWQSDVFKIGGSRQDAYLLADAFASYQLSDQATLRLNVMNLSDKKYLRTVAYGGIYGAPRNFGLTVDYKL